MAESAKYQTYTRNLMAYFKRADKSGDLYPSYSGYTPWNDGYKAGFAAGKAKGKKEAEEKFRD